MRQVVLANPIRCGYTGASVLVCALLASLLSTRSVCHGHLPKASLRGLWGTAPRKARGLFRMIGAFFTYARRVTNITTLLFFTSVSQIINGYKSIHSGLKESIKTSFFCLVQPLICFSLAMASRTLSNSSYQTSLSRLYLDVNPLTSLFLCWQVRNPRSFVMPV